MANKAPNVTESAVDAAPEVAAISVRLATAAARHTWKQPLGASEVARLANAEFRQARDPMLHHLTPPSSFHDQNAGFFTQYSVEELDGLASDPALSRYSGPLVRGYKAIFDQMTALPKVIIAAMKGDAMGGGFELTFACDLRIGQRGTSDTETLRCAPASFQALAAHSA